MRCEGAKMAPWPESVLAGCHGPRAAGRGRGRCCSVSAQGSCSFTGTLLAFSPHAAISELTAASSETKCLPLTGDDGRLDMPNSN